MDTTVLLVLWVISAAGAAYLGSRKGEAVTGALLGLFFGPIGLIGVWLSKARCPHCKEPCDDSATVCPHCRSAISR